MSKRYWTTSWHGCVFSTGHKCPAAVTAIGEYLSRLEKLAAIIEQVTGLSYECFLRQQLFEPAGLYETPEAVPELYQRLADVESELDLLAVRLWGDGVRGQWNEASSPAILGRLGLELGGLEADFEGVHAPWAPGRSLPSP